MEEFGLQTKTKIEAVAQPLLKNRLLDYANNHYFLTDRGVLISNQIFEKFTFSKDDLRIDN